jgi:predicted ester cyclase
MREANEIIDAFVSAINDSDETALRSILHDDFVDHSANPGQAPGRDAFINEKLDQLRTSFPDFVLGVEEVPVAGQRIAFRWKLTGLNGGRFAGQDATGKRVDFEGMNIEHVQDGRITDHWSIHDALALFNQLGRLG